MADDSTASTRHDDGDSCEVSQELADLHRVLQTWCSKPDWSATDSATADAQLQHLRRSSAGIQRSSGHSPLKSADTESLELQTYAAAISCMELLTDMLLQPPQALYSGLSGAPSQPGSGLELAGEQQQLVLAAQLQLLSQLVLLLGELEVPPAAEQPCAVEAASTGHNKSTQARNRPAYFEGIVVIEELPNEADSRSSQTLQRQLQQQLQQLTLQLLLVAALYSTDSSSSSGSSSACMALTACITAAGAQTPAAAAAAASSGGTTSSNCQDLGRFCGNILQQGLQLSTPWSGPSAQQQARQLAQQLISSIRVDNQSSSADKSGRSKHSLSNTSKQKSAVPAGYPGKGHDGVTPRAAAEQVSSACSAEQQQECHQQLQPLQQQEEEDRQQQVWSHVVPLLLDKLRNALLSQHRHRKLQEKGDLVPYTGPPTFHRCLAARQLSWLVQQLQPHALAEPQTLGLLLPLVLAVADDPSPCVQQYGHSALGWLGLQAAAGAHAGGAGGAGGSGLRWQAALLREEARRLVVGCEETCWRSAMPAATCLTLALKGNDQRSPTYHCLLLELLQEAERSAHKPQPRLLFMACVSLLVPGLGLYVVRHLASLMPLLLEWVHAYDADSSVVALQLLHHLVVFAWPRMSVHAGVIRRHVQQVVQQELVEQGVRAAGRQQQQQDNGRCGESVEGHAAVAGSVCSRRYCAAQELLQLLSCW